MPQLWEAQAVTQELRYTVYAGEYPMSHHASKAAAVARARSVIGQPVIVVERDRAYPFTHHRRWKITR